ncbi:MAG: hypothetical protein AAB547_02955 [Patescibacteria group bacterium]
MEMLMTRLREGCGRHLVVIILVALAVVEALSLVALTRMPSQPGLLIYGEEERGVIVTQPVLKISEIRGPRIDDEAAMIVADESAELSRSSRRSSCATQAAVSPCPTLPIGIWIFLLAAYVALLIFNFSYTFRQAARPQWFWETLYTALALIGWYAWDGCRDHIWFPFAVVQFGLITFAIYAYLLEKRLLEKEKQDTTQKA